MVSVAGVEFRFSSLLARCLVFRITILPLYPTHRPHEGLTGHRRLLIISIILQVGLLNFLCILDRFIHIFPRIKLSEQN